MGQIAPGQIQKSLPEHTADKWCAIILQPKQLADPAEYQQQREDKDSLTYVPVLSETWQRAETAGSMRAGITRVENPSSCCCHQSSGILCHCSLWAQILSLCSFAAINMTAYWTLSCALFLTPVPVRKCPDNLIKNSFCFKTCSRKRILPFLVTG